MESIRRNLKRARESDPMSREQYSYDSWSPEAKGFESSALTSVKALVSFWADEYTLRGDKLKGQDLVRWKKEVYSRIQELDKIFKEDEKLRKEVKNE